MKNFVQPGKTISLVAPYTVVSGAGLLVGSIFGVASDDAANGASVEAETVGVFDLAKDTSTFSQGDKVYWDNTAKACTSTSSGNTFRGVAMQAQLTGDATVRVRLNGIGV